MTTQYKTVAVPFVKIGNRRGLTRLQIVEMPWLADFVKRFPTSFEPAADLDAVLFIEPDATDPR